jgi:hypothetical protein
MPAIIRWIAGMARSYMQSIDAEDCTPDINET